MTKNKVLGLTFSAKNYRRMITHTFLAAATREKSTHFCPCSCALSSVFQ